MAFISLILLSPGSLYSLPAEMNSPVRRRRAGSTEIQRVTTQWIRSQLSKPALCEKTSGQNVAALENLWVLSQLVLGD